MGVGATSGRALVTGGTGFVGSHVVRRLLAEGLVVRVLARRESSLRALEGLPVEVVAGDLRRPETLAPALDGCRFLFHVAADYRLWCPDPEELYRANVAGTAALMDAARRSGSVERIVYTSSVGALGLRPDGTPADEQTPVALAEMVGHYKRSKYLAEEEVRRRAEEGLPVVLVHPSTPVGPGDWKPTPTGQMIVDFLNGRMPAYVDTGLNLVAVEDVAAGHWLAATRGRVGERYILGCRNLSLREILGMLATLTGRPAPRFRMPVGVAIAMAHLDGWVEGGLLRREPRIPLEGARMARKKMYFSAARAVRELGLPQSRIEEALARAVAWYREQSYVRSWQPSAVNGQRTADR
jgi:dihydroflavonol-4-reductase